VATTRRHLNLNTEESHYIYIYIDVYIYTRAYKASDPGDTNSHAARGQPNRSRNGCSYSERDTDNNAAHWDEYTYPDAY
jgi:hypothetical protein